MNKFTHIRSLLSESTLKTTVAKIPNDWVFPPENNPAYDSKVHKVHADAQDILTPGKFGHVKPGYAVTKITVYGKDHKTTLSKASAEATKLLKKDDELKLLYISTTGLKGEDARSERWKQQMFIGTAYLVK